MEVQRKDQVSNDLEKRQIFHVARRIFFRQNLCFQIHLLEYAIPPLSVHSSQKIGPLHFSYSLVVLDDQGVKI